MKIFEIVWYQMKRRVNIQIRDDVNQAKAVERLARVMSEGRVSGDGRYYCWVSTFADGVVVVTRGPGRRFDRSDSFIVYKETTRCAL